MMWSVDDDWIGLVLVTTLGSVVLWGVRQIGGWREFARLTERAFLQRIVRSFHFPVELEPGVAYCRSCRKDRRPVTWPCPEFVRIDKRLDELERL